MSSRIKKRESEIDAICDGAVKAGFKAIALAFEQGDDLILVKAGCKHGEWEEWLEKNFEKGQDTARRYMKMAAVPKDDRSRLLTEAKSINDCFRTLGIIAPEPVKAIENHSTISIPPFIQRLNWIAEYYSKSPPDIDAMQDGEREELKTKLKPIIQIYEKL